MDDIFDEDLIEYDWQQKDKKYLGNIKRQMAERGLSDSDLTFAELQKEVDLRLKLKHP